MPLIFPSNTLSAAGGVDNSCMFNRADSPVLTRTHGTPTLGTKFTWSGWVKRSTLGADQYFAMHWQDSSDYGYFYFRTGDDIRFFDRHTGDSDTVWISNSLFRDISAWYHIFIKCDTTQATDTNRFKVFINGVQDTGNGITYPAQDAEMAFSKASDTDRISIGGSGDGSNHMGGYFSEVAFMDGTAYDHTDLGEFDEDSPTIWKPKDPSTLTFGDNGYYLDFEDSDNLGDDESGNASDFTETNIDATDQATDTPTNSFATFNSLSKNESGTVTFSEGNLYTAHSGSDSAYCSYSTIGIASGKWYGEFKFVASSGGTDMAVGVGYDLEENNRTGAHIGYSAGSYDYNAFGNKHNDGNESSYGDTYGVGDIIGVALDLDNHKLYFSKNGTWQDSGDPESGATGTGSAFDLTTGQTYFMGASHATATSRTTDYAGNYGGCPAFAISSGNADGNGYGNFEYAPPSGYLAPCTKNLGSDGG